MPAKRHVAGAGGKQQRQYEHIKESYQKRGSKRAKEIAARTVNKQKGSRKKS